MKNLYKFKETSRFSCFGCGAANCSMCRFYEAKTLQEVFDLTVKEIGLRKAVQLLLSALEEA